MPSYTITLTSPNGGGGYTVGTTQNITWSSSGNIGSYCFVQLYIKDGSNFILHSIIAEGLLVSAGSYSWTIPENLIAGRYKVKISATSNSAINDMSDAEFSINSIAESLTITDVGHQTYYFGETTSPIRWTTTGTIPRVDIKVRQGAGSWITLASNVINTNSYSWTIVESQTVAGSYIFAVYDSSDNSIADAGGDIYTVGARANPSLTMITPQSSSDVYVKGSSANIEYSITNIDYNQYSNLFVEAIFDSNGHPQDGESHIQINPSSTPLTSWTSSYYQTSGSSSINYTASGSYNWALPLTDISSASDYLIPSTSGNYKFKVSRPEYYSSGVDSYADLSDFSFGIKNAPSSISVTAPVSGENLVSKGVYYIRWESISLSGYVDISLYSGITLVETLFSGYSTQGTNWSASQGSSPVLNTATWTVGENVRPNSTYRIKITSNSNSTVYGWSDYFSVINSPSSFFADIDVAYLSDDKPTTSTEDWGFDNRGIEDSNQNIDNTLLSKTRIDSNSFVASSTCIITWKKLFTRDFKPKAPTEREGWFSGKNISYYNYHNNDNPNFGFPVISYAPVDVSNIPPESLDKSGSVIIALYRKSPKYSYGVDGGSGDGYEREYWRFPSRSFYRDSKGNRSSYSKVLGIPDIIGNYEFFNPITIRPTANSGFYEWKIPLFQEDAIKELNDPSLHGDDDLPTSTEDWGFDNRGWGSRPLRGNTSTNDGHSHTYIVDEIGNGVALEVENIDAENRTVSRHFHRVREWVIDRAGDNPHTHTLSQSSSQVEPNFRIVIFDSKNKSIYSSSKNFNIAQFMTVIKPDKDLRMGERCKVRWVVDKLYDVSIDLYNDNRFYSNIGSFKAPTFFKGLSGDVSRSHNHSHTYEIDKYGYGKTSSDSYSYTDRNGRVVYQREHTHNIVNGNVQKAEGHIHYLPPTVGTINSEFATEPKLIGTKSVYKSSSSSNIVTKVTKSTSQSTDSKLSSNSNLSGDY